MEKKLKLFSFSSYLIITLFAFSNSVLSEPSEVAPSNLDSKNEEQLERKDNVRDKEIRALSEIKISADPFSPTLLEYGNPVSILKKKKILINAEPTIGETISKEPGVSSSYFGPGSSRPIIRGNAGERVRVLSNGIGSQDASNTSEDHAVSINPLTAESIEILRGPETLLFGSTASGGVVNVIDNSIPGTAIGKPLTGAIDLRLGTADDELTGAVKLEGQAGKFNWHTNYFHQDSDDIEIPGLAESEALREQEAAEGEEHEEEIPEGTLPDSDTRSQGFTTGGSYIWNKGFFGVSVNGWESNYGIPGHSEEEGEEEEEEEHGEEEEGVAIDAKQLRVDLRGEVREVSSAVENIKFKLGLSTYEHDEIEGGELGTRFEKDSIEGRLELTHAPIGDLEGIVGVQLQANDLEAAGEEAFIPQVDTFSPAIFLFEELPLKNNLRLQAGLRYDYVNYDANGFSGDDFHPIGVSTGLVYDPTGDSSYTIGLSAAYTQRAPAATELYSNGAHVARSTFELGDENLNEEKSFNLDFTAKKNTGLITGEFNLFVQDYNDFINLRGTGEEEDGLPVFNYEAVDAVFWGFEIKNTLHLHEALGLWSHDLDLVAQVDYIRARNQSESEDLPRIPPLRTIVGLEYAYKKDFSASIEGVFVSRQSDTSEFELPTEAYQLLNTSLSYNLPIKNTYELEFYARGTNLSDQEARVHSSFIKDLAPLRGRSFLFGIRGVF